MRITEDLYSVAERLKEIDRAYFVNRNEASGRYELHRAGSLPTYVLAFPFDGLDARAVEFARKTRAERAERLLEEIERNNLRLETEARYRAKEKIGETVERAAGNAQKR